MQTNKIETNSVQPPNIPLSLFSEVRTHLASVIGQDYRDITLGRSGTRIDFFPFRHPGLTDDYDRPNWPNISNFFQTHILSSDSPTIAQIHDDLESYRQHGVIEDLYDTSLYESGWRDEYEYRRTQTIKPNLSKHFDRIASDPQYALEYVTALQKGQLDAMRFLYENNMLSALPPPPTYEEFLREKIKTLKPVLTFASLPSRWPNLVCNVPVYGSRFPQLGCTLVYRSS